MHFLSDAGGFTVIGLLLLASLLGQAPDTAKAAEAAAATTVAVDVGRLVRQLDSDELTRRDKAEQDLIALGPAAAAHLPAITDRTPAEVAQRLARVRHAFEKARAEQAAKASTVTIHGEMPLKDALKAFSQQTGNSVTPSRQLDDAVLDRAVRLDLDKADFWPALDQLLDAQKLDVDSFSGEPGVVVVERAEGRLARTARASYSGPLRLEAVRFEAVNDLRAPGNHGLKLFIDVAWEPRLRPIVLSQPLDQVSALVGDKPLAIAGQGEPTAPLAADAAAVELMVPLAPPARDVEKISRLKGKINVLVPGEVETFRFADVPSTKGAGAKKIEQRKAAVTVALDGLRKNNDLWEMRLRVRFDDPNAALDSYLSGWLLDNEALFEKDGQEPIAPSGFEQTLQTANEIGGNYLFELPGGPKGYVFVYKSPTAVFNIPVEYQFEDLDLP